MCSSCSGSRHLSQQSWKKINSLLKDAPAGSGAAAQDAPATVQEFEQTRRR